MKEVRFSQMSEQSLLETVSREKLVVASPGCNRFLLEVSQFRYGDVVSDSPRFRRRMPKGWTDGIWMIGSEIHVNQLFDPISLTWRRARPFVRNRCSFGLVTAHRRVYAFGGRDADAILSSAECYDPRIDTWTPIPNMRQSRFSFGSCELGGLVYACGGTGK